MRAKLTGMAVVVSVLIGMGEVRSQSVSERISETFREAEEERHRMAVEREMREQRRAAEAVAEETWRASLQAEDEARAALFESQMEDMRLRREIRGLENRELQRELE